MAELRYRFEVWQAGQCVASGDGDDANAVRANAIDYAMIYAKYGRVEVRLSPRLRPARPHHGGAL